MRRRCEEGVRRSTKVLRAPTSRRLSCSAQRASAVPRGRGSSYFLVRDELANCLEDVRCAGQDSFLENGCVRHRAIETGDPSHGSIEILEQLLADTRRKLGAEATGERVLVGDDDAADFLCVGDDRLPIVRNDRTKVDYGNAEAVAFGLRRREQRTMDQ